MDWEQHTSDEFEYGIAADQTKAAPGTIILYAQEVDMMLDSLCYSYDLVMQEYEHYKELYGDMPSRSAKLKGLEQMCIRHAECMDMLTLRQTGR